MYPFLRPLPVTVGALCYLGCPPFVRCLCVPPGWTSRFNVPANVPDCRYSTVAHRVAISRIEFAHLAQYVHADTTGRYCDTVHDLEDSLRNICALWVLAPVLIDVVLGVFERCFGFVGVAFYVCEWLNLAQAPQCEPVKPLTGCRR